MEAGDYFALLRERAIPVVLDDPANTPALTELGFRIVAFDDYDFLTQQERPALVLLTRMESIGRLHALWGASAALFCHLALAKFDSDPQSLAYTLAQLMFVDPAAALARRAQRYDQLLSCQDLEIRTAAGTLRCHMQNELEIPNPGTVIEPGCLYSIAEFFEASVVNLGSERASFWVEGDLSCDGLIYLCNNGVLKAQTAPLLDDLLRRAASGRSSVRFEDNQLARVILGGEDVTSAFLALTAGKEAEGAATEFGLGCAEFGAEARLHRNVVLHKSGPGAYVGIGKGLYLPHIDFIARGAELVFLGPESSGTA